MKHKSEADFGKMEQENESIYVMEQNDSEECQDESRNAVRDGMFDTHNGAESVKNKDLLTHIPQARCGSQI